MKKNIIIASVVLALLLLAFWLSLNSRDEKDFNKEVCNDSVTFSADGDNYGGTQWKCTPYRNPNTGKYEAKYELQ